MPAIGITGHIHLTPGSARPISDALIAIFTKYADHGPLHGVTCLAGGADQIFARAVLTRHGTFDVILPARDYRAVLPADNRTDFDELLARARKVDMLDREHSDLDAYLAASAALLDRSDLLVAVWDRAAGSATADVVALARHRGLPIQVVWPPGAARI
jgi:hypothetical protein